MMRATMVVIACSLLCDVASGQIIVRGGSKSSFVQSGRVLSAQATAGGVSPTDFASSPAPTSTQPVVTLKIPQVTSSTVTISETRYLVSEPWCVYCPAAKRAFLQRGNDERNVISIAEAVRRFPAVLPLDKRGRPHVPHVPFEFVVRSSAAPTVTHTPSSNSTGAALRGSVLSRYIRFPSHPEWGTVDLQTWRHCGNPRCQMDNAVQPYWQRYQEWLRRQSNTDSTDTQRQVFQAGADAAVIAYALDAADLQPATDVLCDVGSGDGRILIAAARRGIRGVGIEIDPVLADQSRRAIADAGLSELIHIVTGDATDASQFDPTRYGVTAFVAYQHEELLRKLQPMLFSGRVCVTLFHAVPDANMIRRDDVFVWQSDRNNQES